MKRMTPSFEYKQYDYSPESELEIKGRAILQAVLKILKAIREKERTDLIEGFMEFVISVENEKDIQLANEIFDLGLAYITNIERNITEKELIQASLERGDVVQSLAQRLRNEGMEKEKNKIPMEMLNEGLSYEMIQRITKLSMEKIEELKKHIKN